ncbi:MAG TPA: hypothetical protein VHL58_00575 [Thermoanaerobaculia bacterium]|nr:hypothetical protein [Thermoanaerobaculia bacterium]
MSSQDFELFQRTHAAEYAVIDQEYARLTESEGRLASFDTDH